MPFARGDLVETAPDQGPRFPEGYSAVVTAVEHTQGLELVSVRWTGTPPPGLRPISERCYASRFQKVSSMPAKFVNGEIVRCNAIGARESGASVGDTAKRTRDHGTSGASYFLWLSGPMKDREMAYYDKNFDKMPKPATEGFILLEMMDDKAVWHPVGTPKPAKEWEMLDAAGKEEGARLKRPFRISALIIGYSIDVEPAKVKKTKKAT